MVANVIRKSVIKAITLGTGGSSVLVAFVLVVVSVDVFLGVFNACEPASF